VKTGAASFMGSVTIFASPKIHSLSSNKATLPPPLRRKLRGVDHYGDWPEGTCEIWEHLTGRSSRKMLGPGIDPSWFGFLTQANLNPPRRRRKRLPALTPLTLAVSHLSGVVASDQLAFNSRSGQGMPVS
jgi:hypothetical protein